MTEDLVDSFNTVRTLLTKASITWPIKQMFSTNLVAWGSHGKVVYFMP